MGNSDIRDIAHISTENQASLSGYNVTVDASNWLYKYMTTTTRFTSTSSYTDSAGRELPNLLGVVRGCRKFFRYNVTPLFVFDGKPHSLKREEIERRKQKRQKARDKAREATTSSEESKYKSRGQELNNEVIKTTKQILNRLDINYITAPQSAESQAGYMVNNGRFDGAVSDDYDTVVFGCQKTIRKYTKSDGEVEIMSLSKTLKEKNITEDQVIFATILCGTDYNSGVKGLGPVRSVSKAREFDSIDSFVSKFGDRIENAREIYQIYKNPEIKTKWPDYHIPRPDPDSVMDYLNEKGVDSSEVARSLKEINESGSQTGLGNF